MEFYKSCIVVCTLVGAITMVVLFIGFIKAMYDILYKNYIDRKIKRTNWYIGKYCSIIDRFIEETADLSPHKSLTEEEVTKIDLNICKLINEYKGIK